MQTTQRRLDEAAFLSSADFTARYPHPVLIAIEILAGHLRKQEPKAPDLSALRRTARGFAVHRGPATARKPSFARPELRAETMERHRNIDPTARDFDPMMQVDRPIRRPYFFELRKNIPDFPGKVIIGRVQPCDVVISDYTISSKHAAFEYHQHRNVFLLSDLGSTNGTSVESNPLAPQLKTIIRSGMLIEFGRIKVRFLTAPDFYQWLHVRRTLTA